MPLLDIRRAGSSDIVLSNFHKSYCLASLLVGARSARFKAPDWVGLNHFLVDPAVHRVDHWLRPRIPLLDIESDVEQMRYTENQLS